MSAKQYPSDLEPNSSHAHAAALLGKPPTDGAVVLDLGCGNGPMAEPLSGAGWVWVGSDVEDESLDPLAERGFEVHRLDLMQPADDLRSAVVALLDGRPLGGVLALDVLEHLVDPRAVVDALAAVAADHDEVALVVSLPNVTHVDVASKLLIGRWDLTDMGLLDDTHLRFFDAAGVDRLFAGSGWGLVDEDDTLAVRTEQHDQIATAALEPAAPLRNLLWRLRSTAEPHGTTYQFVRRYDHGAAERTSTTASGDGAEDAAAAPFLTAVVRLSRPQDRDGLPLLLDDLAAQDDPDLSSDLELVVLVGDGGERPELPDGAAVVEVSDVHSNRNLAVPVARGRYLAFLDGATRVGPGYLRALRSAMDAERATIRADAVVRLDAVALEGEGWTEVAAGDFDEVVADRGPITPDGFDLLGTDPSARTALAAHAIPRSAFTTLGLLVDERCGDSATTVVVARAVELCGLRGIADVQVAVPDERARPAAVDLPALRDHFAASPLFVDAGGAARLVARRQQLIDATNRLAAAEEQLAAAREAEASHRAAAEEFQANARRWEAEVLAMYDTKLYRALKVPRAGYRRARRLAASLRARLGGA